MEKDREPGSAKFGNFINYYSFNPPGRRLTVIPRSLMTDFGIGVGHDNIRILDVGCNTGDLTLALFEHLDKGKDKRVSCLGVDLDPVLIQRGQEKNSNEFVSFATVDVMSPSGRQWLQDYMAQEAIIKFDLVTCFSITMWVHLNHGDAGLRDFLQYVSSVTSHVLIEPQPWKCYKTAMRRMRKLDCDTFEHFEGLAWRKGVVEEIQDYLVETCRFRQQGKGFGATEDWERQISLFSGT